MHSQLFTICRSIIILGMLISLQGCWFIFIPVGAVSDAFTGAEGSHCVSSYAKVGDHITLNDGKVGTVKSLSGTSNRCKNPAHPIRALLTFDDEQ